MVLAIVLVYAGCSDGSSDSMDGGTTDTDTDTDTDIDTDADTDTDTDTDTDSDPPSGDPCTNNPWSCDPVTNNGCSGANEACDWGTSSDVLGFYCFGDSTEPLGAACNQSGGPWCAPGMTCYEDVCEKYCCSTADCAGAACEPPTPYWELVTGDNLGLCAGDVDTDTDTDTDVDAGSDAGSDAG